MKCQSCLYPLDKCVVRLRECLSIRRLILISLQVEFFFQWCNNTCQCLYWVRLPKKGDWFSSLVSVKLCPSARLPATHSHAASVHHSLKGRFSSNGNLPDPIAAALWTLVHTQPNWKLSTPTCSPSRMFKLEATCFDIYVSIFFLIFSRCLMVFTYEENKISFKQNSIRWFPQKKKHLDGQWRKAIKWRIRK